MTGGLRDSTTAQLLDPLFPWNWIRSHPESTVKEPASA
jgi:hypothetical protein